MRIKLETDAECRHCGCPLMCGETAFVDVFYDAIACSNEHLNDAILDIRDAIEHSEYLEAFEKGD